MTGAGRASPKRRAVTARTSGYLANRATPEDHAGQIFTAWVVAVLIFVSAAISLYDLYLVLRLLRP